MREILRGCWWLHGAPPGAFACAAATRHAFAILHSWWVARRTLPHDESESTSSSLIDITPCLMSSQRSLVSRLISESQLFHHRVNERSCVSSSCERNRVLAWSPLDRPL